MKCRSQSISPREPVSSVVDLIENDAGIIGELSKEARILRHLLIGNDEPVIISA
jgi:hypothetical protein